MKLQLLIFSLLSATAYGKRTETHVFNVKTTTEAQVFNEPHLPDGLRLAEGFAGSEGFVVSLPQLFSARVKASFDNTIWNNWYTTLSEESVVFDQKRGKTVVVLIHGGGILDADRIDRIFRTSKGMTQDGEGRGGALLSQDEASNIVKGILPDGTQIKMYDYNDYVNETRVPSRHGIILDFDVAKESLDGYTEYSILKKDPLFIARAGGVNAAAQYLDKLSSRNVNTTRMGNWHPFNRIDSSIPQTRITFMSGNLGGVGSNGGNSNPYQGYNSDYGIGGDANINNRGRFISVRPQSSESIRNLPFTTISSSSSNIRLEASEVFEASLPTAMMRAKWSCISTFGNDFELDETPTNGRVASVPEIVRARVSASFENDIWTKRYATYSDQSICRLSSGKHVVITIHGGGILSSPERILKSFRMDRESLTGQYASILSKSECELLFENHTLPDGTHLSTMYESYDAFANASSPHPNRFGVIVDFDTVKSSMRGYVNVNDLKDDPWFHVSIGSVELARKYLDKIATHSSTVRIILLFIIHHSDTSSHDYCKQVGNWPPFEEIFWNVRQSRIIFLDTDGGILGTNGMINEARFVSLAPTNVSSSLVGLSF